VEHNRFSYGTKKNAKRAAEECGIKKWYWGTPIPVHGPQPEHPAFAFDVDHLPQEPTSNQEMRIKKIYDCLDASFARQKVRINFAGAA
jgi:hypothetical protein